MIGEHNLAEKLDLVYLDKGEKSQSTDVATTGIKEISFKPKFDEIEGQQ